MFSERIKAIASLVPQNKIVLDIGTDHAYLPIFLLLNHISPSVIASDISPNALKQAEKNIKRFNLENKIKLIVSDGTQKIADNYDLITISGMGTKTILEILNNNLTKNEYIIQSNNNLDELRKFFNQNGYSIAKEIVVYEDKFYYPIIYFIKGKEVLDNKYLYYGKSFDKAYLKHELNKNKDILVGIPENKNSKIETNIKYLEELLEECENIS